MEAKRRVRLLRIGDDQAVHIPRDFELPGDDAIMRKDGDCLILELAPAKSLLAVLADLQPLEEGFPAIDGLPPGEVKL